MVFDDVFDVTLLGSSFSLHMEFSNPVSPGSWDNTRAMRSLSLRSRAAFKTTNAEGRLGFPRRPSESAWMRLWVSA